MKERIKAIRKTLPGKLTQEEFGAAIGVSRDTISNFELGRVDPPESIIKLISTTYKINYQWLKYGEGEMLLPPDSLDEMVDEVMAGENEFAKSVFRAFAQLGDAEWHLLKRIVELIQGKED